MRKSHLLLLAAPLFALPAVAQDFAYPDFSSTVGLALNGDAAAVGGALRVSSAAISTKGSAYRDAAVPVSGGFDTRFSFQITGQSGGGADGFTFLIHNDARGTSLLADHGGGLGYSGFPTAAPGVGALNSLAIEFDTWTQQTSGGFPTGEFAGSNEISVHTGGTGENDFFEAWSIARVNVTAASGINMSDGAVHTARIRYVPGTLEIYLDDLSSPLLTAVYSFSNGATWLQTDPHTTPPHHMAGDPVDGLDLIGGSSAFVGFTAAAGGAWENHDILSWDWTSGSATDELCNGDGGDLSGCTNCPCGNNSIAGTIGGCINSAGTSTRLLRSGSSSIATADLRFEASGAPAAASAVLTSGNALAPANPANPCFGLNSGIQSVNLDGLRCVVQGVLRHGVRPSDGNGDIGVQTNGWGTPNGFFQFSVFTAGSTKHFQIIHRDSESAVCQTGQNSSQAVSITFGA